MIKKDVVIAVLVTFCLTATLFMIIPTNSASTRPYDAWVDYDEDGQIGPYDLAQLISHYGASGDPTKNVNVTNFPLDQNGNVRVSSASGTPSWHNATFIYDIIDFDPDQEWSGTMNFGGAIVSEALFDFQPICETFQVLELWVSFVYGPREHYGTYYGNFTGMVINGITADQGAPSADYPTYLAIEITDTTILQSIRYGANRVIFIGQTSSLRFWRITVHITYTYYG